MIFSDPVGRGWGGGGGGDRGGERSATDFVARIVVKTTSLLIYDCKRIETFLGYVTLGTKNLETIIKNPKN